MWGHRRWQCYACSAECQQHYSQQGDPEHLPIPRDSVAVPHPGAVTGLPRLLRAWHVSPSSPSHPSCESVKAPPAHHDRRPSYSWRCQSQAWRGFFRQDSFVLPKDKPPTFLYEADSNFKPWMDWDLHRPPSKSVFLTTTLPLPVSIPGLAVPLLLKQEQGKVIHQKTSIFIITVTAGRKLHIGTTFLLWSIFTMSMTTGR